MFERVAVGDKLLRDQLGEFFNECGHFPTEGEITAAFNAVFRGLYRFDDTLYTFKAKNYQCSDEQLNALGGRRATSYDIY